MRWVAVAVILASGAMASADTVTPEAKAQAEALFQEGRRLGQQGKYDEACVKFEASLRLERSIGTMLNLGDCFERVQRFASAWALFREAGDESQRLADTERARIARDRAAALEGRVSHLTIRAPSETIPGLVILRNGVAIDASLLGIPIPVDAGTQHLEYRAAGRASAVQDVAVAVSASAETTVPALAPDANATAPVAAPVAPTAPTPATPANTTELQIVVPTNERYSVELATTSGVLRCDAEVTRDRPCKLAGALGPASLTLQGSTSLSEDLKLSGKPILVTVEREGHFMRTAGIAVGAAGAVAAGVGAYACTQREGSLTASAGGLTCLTGSVFGGVALIAGVTMIVTDLTSDHHHVNVHTDGDDEDQDSEEPVAARPHRSYFATALAGGLVGGITSSF